jgi:hypothetical protein
MKVLAENMGEAIWFSDELQKMMRQIELSDMPDICKTASTIFLCKIRDAVKIEEAKNG